MFGVVKDLDAGLVGRRGGGRRFAAAEVARESWECAARDLDANAVSGLEDMCCGRELQRYLGDAVRGEMHQLIAQVHRPALVVDVAEAYEHVAVRPVCAHPGFGADVADHLQVRIQDR